jgi:hypothetical protein
MSDGPSHIPPPPQEVSIRTLKSDLESFSQSGGSSPSFTPLSAGPTVKKTEKADAPSGSHADTWMIVAGLLILAGMIAYYFLFLK